MTGTILNFKKNLKLRQGDGQTPPHTNPTATAGPVPKDAPFETGTLFNLSSIVHLEDTDAVGFRDAEAEAQARAVCARFGLELDLYAISFERVVSAALALDWAASEIGVTHSVSKRGTAAFREYAAAFSDKDTAAAKRLAGAAGLLDRVAAECDRARHRLIVTGRPRLRSNARKNAIVAYLLGLKAPGGLDAGTLEQVQSDMFFSRTRESESGKAAMNRTNSIQGTRPALCLCTKPASAVHTQDVLDSPGGAKLRKLGLWTLSNCPRPGEAAVLFQADNVAVTMDRSRLKNGWSALLGPFVGFDSNYRLLLESDLEWWRMERERHGSDWAGLPMALAMNQLPPPAQKKPARAKSAATAAAAAQRALKAKATKGPPAVLELMRQLSNTAVKKARATNDKAKFEFEGASATGAFEGMLTILGHEFKMADADVLGTIAFICGAATVKTIIPSYEDVIVLRAKSSNVVEIGKADTDEREFLWQFHDALHAADTAALQTSATLELWTEKRLAPALALVPEHLWVKTAFAPGNAVVSNAL